LWPDIDGFTRCGNIFHIGKKTHVFVADIYEWLSTPKMSEHTSGNTPPIIVNGWDSIVGKEFVEAPGTTFIKAYLKDAPH